VRIESNYLHIRMKPLDILASFEARADQVPQLREM
jgi:hypothetical protein